MQPDKPDTPPDLSDLKSLVKALNQSGRQNDIKRRRAKIDAIVDEEFFAINDILKKLAR